MFIYFSFLYYYSLPVVDLFSVTISLFFSLFSVTMFSFPLCGVGGWYFTYCAPLWDYQILNLIKLWNLRMHKHTQCESWMYGNNWLVEGSERPRLPCSLEFHGVHVVSLAANPKKITTSFRRLVCWSLVGVSVSDAIFLGCVRENVRGPQKSPTYIPP